MAISERTITVLEELSKREEPARPLEIAQALRIEPVTAGKELVELLKGGLAVKTDKDKNTWAITDQGRAHLKTLSPKGTTPAASGMGTGTGTGTGSEAVASTTARVASTTPAPVPETSMTIPSQSDIFRSEGELLAVGTKKGSISLDVIVKWVERTANLDDLDSIWNALTQMAVDDSTKKRWLTLYAQSLPKHKMSEALREKIETGQELETIKTDGKPGEIAPKPRRFSVVGDQIIGDPEGDYNLNEAVKVLAAQRGIASPQVDPLASMMEAVQMGPQMATATLTAMMPLLNKAPDTSVTLALQQQIQALQTQIVTLTEERHKAEMESIRAEIRTGQKTPEADQQMQALNQRLDQLRDDLHQKDIEMITTQNTAIQQQLTNQIARLELQIAAVGQGKSTDSKIGLLGDIVNKGFGEVSGLRSDVKSMIPTILSRGQTVKRRTEAEKEHFSEGLDKGIERAKATSEAEEKLWPELKGS